MLEEKLAELASAEADCQAANVDENDYTVFTYQDLQFEHELVTQGISKKIAFIDNQVCFRLLRIFQHKLTDWTRRSCLAI